MTCDKLPPAPPPLQVCPSLLNLLAGSNSLVQVPLAELLLELDADPDEVEELGITAACVQVGKKPTFWWPAACGLA